mmetsp:Transcript_35487/g.54285  ORF Transcript_35487/g.54285 Transcript_35487/m.54285 type:complete len:86 (-) Transcript_35487:1497-1754(-)
MGSRPADAYNNNTNQPIISQNYNSLFDQVTIQSSEKEVGDRRSRSKTPKGLIDKFSLSKLKQADKQKRVGIKNLKFKKTTVEKGS